MTTPAATTVATDADAINNGLDARSNMLCDLTVAVAAGVLAGLSVPPPVLVEACGLTVADVLGFDVPDEVGVVAEGAAVLLFLALLPEVFADELLVGADVGVTPGT